MIRNHNPKMKYIIAVLVLILMYLFMNTKRILHKLKLKTMLYLFIAAIISLVSNWLIFHGAKDEKEYDPYNFKNDIRQ